MRKSSFWRTFAIVLLGLVLGTIAGQLLSPHFAWLKTRVLLSWHPNVDLSFIGLSINLTLRANWGSLVGAVVAIALLRRQK